MARTLTTLPEELILRILSHAHRLDDLYSLMLTNKLLLRVSHDITPKNISRMALDNGDFFPGLRPYQHTLLVPSARRLADWAVQNDQNRKRLASSMLNGIDGLVSLAMDVVPITLSDIRTVYRWKQEILNPLGEEMDSVCGRPSEPTDGLTVCEDPSLTLLAWVIYGELFHHSISYLYSPNPMTPLDSISRFKFLVYCIPDVNSFTYMDLERPIWFESMAKSADGFQQLSLNYATRHHLDPWQWGTEINELTPGLLEDGDGDGDWNFDYLIKDRLLVTAVLSSGTKSLDILQAGARKRKEGVEPSQEMIGWLLGLHRQIHALPEMETEDGNVGCGEMYDPWLRENWVTLAWDQKFTLWDAGPYTLRTNVIDKYGNEEEAWAALKKAIGEDPLGSERRSEAAMKA